MPTFKSAPIPTSNSKTVVLYRESFEMPLQVRSLSVDFYKTLRDDIGVLKLPKIKQTFSKNPDGSFKKDPKTGTIITEDVPEGEEIWDTWNSRFVALRLRDILRESPDLEWETTAPNSSDLSEWQAYADALNAEITASGFTRQETDKLFSISDELACKIDVDGALKSF